DGGTGGRMLGRLLSWMQDNRHGVYVIATANSLERVPPELLRRGRFDDHFRLDPPNQRGCREILEIELGTSMGDERARGPARALRAALEDDEVRMLAKTLAEQHYSGADIAALVRGASRVAILQGAKALGMEHFERARSSFAPQAAQFKGELAALEKTLDAHAFRRATSENGDAQRTRKERSQTPLDPELLQLLRGRDPRI